MHACHCEVVVVVVGQHYSAHHHCNHATHLEELGHHVTQDAEDVGEGHLGHRVLGQEPAFLEDPGAE